MSLIIKGMDMPKSCHDCDLFSGEGFLCPLVIETTNNWVPEFMYKRVDECPLVEIPTPHGRLIDADELKKDRINLYGTTDVVLMVDIENAPTIIEAEVSE